MKRRKKNKSRSARRSKTESIGSARKRKKSKELRSKTERISTECSVTQSRLTSSRWSLLEVSLGSIEASSRAAVSSTEAAIMASLPLLSTRSVTTKGQLSP